MKCESCTKYDDCRTGSGLTWPCGAYRPKAGSGTDIEKLVERLRTESLYADKASLEIMDLCMDAATTLSTLQAENEKLRAELEQVKRDRDSIEQDFRAFTKQWWEEDNGFPCRWCKFERQGGCEWKVKHPGEICAGRAFEWFGQKED